MSSLHCSKMGERQCGRKCSACIAFRNMCKVSEQHYIQLFSRQFRAHCDVLESGGRVAQ